MSSRITLGPIQLSGGMLGTIIETGQPIQVRDVLETHKDGTVTNISSVMVLIPTLHLYALDDAQFVSEEWADDKKSVSFHFSRNWEGCDIPKFTVQCAAFKPFASNFSEQCTISGPK